ncbi:MFS transporter [Pedobacter metabolipauper]|uniref:Putative MFS family arabinose efflux permease n=1 Tax=Pedobacter metabolipauper TaxID=425513 RepID=A0A4R6SZP1_9SPHI|nr:MFS transporter [Pedobacter metabolipauper]TDQ10222.1 putative MFS family arabinose efflux permease [Pedobacter metabolipauper]
MVPSTKEKSSISNFRAWAVVFVLLLLTIVAFIDRGSISLMIDPIKKDLNVSDIQMSWLQGTAFAVFFLLGSLPMGWIVDRFSKRWTVYIGVTVWSIATIACGLSGNYIELLIARCIVGLGEAVLQPAGWSMVAKIFPKERLSSVISILTAGTQIGAAISFLLGGYLISEASQLSAESGSFLHRFEPWQLVFFASGIPGVILAYLIFFAPKEKVSLQKKETNASNGGALQYLIENRSFFICHFLGYGFLCAMVYGAASWLPTYLIRSHQFDVKNVGLLMAIMAVPIGMFGALGAGWFVDRSFSNGKNDAHFSHFVYRTLIIVFVGTVGFCFNQSVAVIIVCFAIIQFLQPFAGVAGASIQIATPEAFRGRISAIFIMFYNALGMILGPSFVILVNDNLFKSQNLGVSIGLNYLVLGGIAAVFLAIGRKYAVLIVTKQNF